MIVYVKLVVEDVLVSDYRLYLSFFYREVLDKIFNGWKGIFCVLMSQILAGI